ncbi:dihydrolipoamide acetyltransferase family protein [Leifsonia sp. A12D58]|uniref:dihydrolipoamide acetyltransferase family protein n=1 Tax=Leifsonia sp. A12D58 TaxID=3397674 RepID=UPI0039E0A980
MIKVFTLPDLGEGLTDSEIVSWLVTAGDTVELNQPLADVETAKATVELPSPFAGVITQLHVGPGDVVQVGEPIVSFDVAGADDDAPQPQPQPQPAEEPEAVADLAQDPDPNPAQVAELEREPVLVGYGAAAERGGRPIRRPRKPLTLPHQIVETSTVEVDYSQDGTQEYDHEPTTETRTPVTGIRRQTAAAMVQSAFTAPQASEFLTIDVTPTLELLESLPMSNGHRVGILAAAAKALCIAVRRNPALNAHWDEATDEIVVFHGVNLGIAVATPRGLIVPTIAHAENQTLVELTDAIARLADTARAGQTRPSELTGSTITITNIGVFGVDAGTPILNPGEAAILALGAIRTLPWEHNNAVALRRVMTLTLTFDHRLVDGEQAAKFLTDVGAILARPGVVLTMV